MARSPLRFVRASKKGVHMKNYYSAWCCALALVGCSFAVQAQKIGCNGGTVVDAGCLRPGELPIIQASSAPGRFASRMIFLADQLERNIDHKQVNATYLIGSFVDLNNMSHTNPMGRLIAENLIHELQVRAWRIVEPRLMQNIMINEGGEFVLSRDVKQLRDKFGVSAVVAGTYVVASDHIVINARVVNVESGVVMSSGQIQIPSSWFSESLMSVPTNRPLKLIGVAQ
jgi:TolB-like protein